MRASLSRWSLLMMTVFCLSLVSFTGCKSGFSMPGSDWLSWAKRPSPTTLAANTYPQKPSAGAIPGATTGTPGYPGYGTSMASTQAGGNNGYYTGPYGTNGASANTGRTSFAQNTYPGAGSMGAGKSSYASSPYQSQSPYASQGSGTTTPSYQTADSRNSYSAAAGQTGATGYTPRTSGQWGGGADAYTSQSAAGGKYPSTGGTSSYSQPASGSYPSTPATGYQAPASTGSYGAAPAGYGTTTAPAATTPRSTTGLTPGPNAYRPGSTGRNGGQMPSAGSSTSTGYAPASGSYPSTTGGYGTR